MRHYSTTSKSTCPDCKHATQKLVKCKRCSNRLCGVCAHAHQGLCQFHYNLERQRDLKKYNAWTGVAK